MSSDRILLSNAAAYAGLAVLCALWRLHDAPLVLGVHPAMKPLKFAISIAIFFATVGWVLPTLSVGEAVRAPIRWVLVAGMAVEIVVILAQAARGRASHFNTATPLDARLWLAMLGAVIAITLAMIVVAIVATARPLALPALVATAVRAGLWLFLVAAVSGFAMGGRGTHAVGAMDGAGGRVPFVGWSTRFGDLRVAHFVALHALQTLPLIGLLARRALERELVPAWAAWTAVVAAVAAHGAVAWWTLARAFAGRPPW